MGWPAIQLVQPSLSGIELVAGQAEAQMVDEGAFAAAGIAEQDHMRRTYQRGQRRKRPCFLAQASHLFPFSLAVFTFLGAEIVVVVSSLI